MDSNIVDESKEVDSSITKRARCPQLSGEGLPYAPVDWPNEGDIWGWKVGKRFDTTSSFYQDRYLIVPKRLQPHRRARLLLRSKNDVKKFLQSEFPDADIDAFLASFSWRVPVKSQPMMKATDTPSPRPRKSTKNEAITPRDTPSPHPPKSTKQDIGEPKDIPSPQKFSKLEAVAPKDTPSPHPPRSTKQDDIAPKDTPSPQKSTKQDIAAPKDTPSPQNSTKKDVVASKDSPSPRPQKSTKQEVVVPKASPIPHPRKSIKLEATEVGGSKTRGKMTQKHVVHGQRTRKSSRLMGKFTTKYAGMLFDLTMESDETDV